MAALVFAGIGLLLQANTHLNHDISWILHSAGKMLHGAEFGRDIIAANPPLAWFLALPVAALAEAFGIHPASAFRGSVAALSFASLAFLWRFLGRDDTLVTRLGRAILLLTGSYALFVGCYRDFGQREYLALVLCLPYLAVTAARMQGQSCPNATAATVGIAAGIGLALKPYFLAVPLFVEILAAIWTRSLRFPVRIETLAAAGFIGLYVVSLPLLTPAYLHDVIPQISRIYWGFDNSLLVTVAKLEFEGFGFAIAVLCAVLLGRRHALLPVLLAAALGFLVSLLVQMKGYSYHSFPFRSLILISLALCAAALFDRLLDKVRRDPKTRLDIVTATLLSGLLISLFNLQLVARENVTEVVQWYGYTNRDDGPYAARTAELVALVDREAGGDRFLALSTHPYPGFPVVIYTSADWASRTNSRIFLPAVAKLRHDVDSGAGGEALLHFAEERARQHLLRDLSLHPRLILINAKAQKHALQHVDFDILAFYLEDPRIRDLFSDYREREPVGDYRVFVLLEGDRGR